MCAMAQSGTVHALHNKAKDVGSASLGATYCHSVKLESAFHPSEFKKKECKFRLNCTKIIYTFVCKGLLLTVVKGLE